MKARRATTLGGALAGVVLMLASCSSGATGGTPAGPSSGGESGSVTSAAVLAEAKKVTEQNIAGTDRALPASSPKAATGKTVWALACSTTAAGCFLPAQGLVDAGTAMGWSMKLVDGKLDPSVYNAQIRAAAAAGASAIALFSVDCAATKGAIEEAQKAGTKVFAANSLDCDDKYAGGGKAMFDGSMVWGPENQAYGPFVDQYVGPSIADWVINATNGSAKIIQLRQDDSAGTRHVGQSQFDRLQQCAGCAVEIVPFTGADLLGGKVQGKVSAALQKVPDATVVMVPTDATISLGAGAAVEQARAAGRKILLVGQEGVPAAIKMLKAGTQSFALGRPWPWTGWAAADAINRMFAGEKPVDAGIGFGSMDANHPPTGDVYDGNAKSAGYKDNYKKIWGVG